MSSDHLLAITGLSLHLSGQAVLRDINLTLAAGQVLALLGPSGGGKTSLLRAIAGLCPLTSGRIWLKKRELTGLPAHQRNLGLMFQDYALFPHLNVYDNINFGLKIKGRRGPEAQRRLKHLLRIMDLEGLENRSILSLSGGQRQRVALARTLAPAPSLLMLDEPLAALDPCFRRELTMHLATVLLQEAEGAVYVTHDQNEALSLSDRIVIIDHGEIIAQGPGRELHRNPPTASAAAFLGYNLLPARLEGRLVQIGSGPGAEAARAMNWVAFNGARQGPVRLAARPEAVILGAAENTGACLVFEGLVTACLKTLDGCRVQVRPLISSRPSGGHRFLEADWRDDRPVRAGDKITISLEMGKTLLYPAQHDF